MTAPKPPKRPGIGPPASLSKPAAQWWEKLMREYSIDDQAGLLLLETTLQAWERMREAQTTIREEGPIIRGDGGRPFAHPCIAIERDSRIAMLHGFKALNLSVEPLRPGPGRPPGA
jgi:P27 family predicted phage terminase small subunit